MSKTISFVVLSVLLRWFRTETSSGFKSLQERPDGYCTTVKDGDRIKFILIGDWGGRQSYPFFTKTQIRVARAMDLVSRINEPAHFFVAVGDNFYPRGVASIDDTRFKDTFEEVYAFRSQQKPWYVVPGNHDYRGSLAAQLHYTNRSDRWKFPTNFYVTRFTTSKKEFLVDFIMIDTITLCGLEEDDAKVQPLEDLHPNITNRREALHWIENQLKLFSRSHYLFVVGHYPVVSAGFHGNNKCLKECLSPLLFAYNVTAYISGHDHTLQHLKYFDDDYSYWDGEFDANHNETHFIISGMGAKRDGHEQSDLEMRPAKKLFFYPRNSRSSTLARTFNKKKLFSKDKGGFVFCTSTRRETKFEFFDAFGRNLYTFRAKPR